MELTSPKIIKELLVKYETRPSKGLGQNFLIDKNVLSKIITASNLKTTDVILEVGPGLGTLTQELAKQAGQVIAIEKDKIMIEILAETLSDFKNIQIIQGDVLKIENWDLKIEKYKLVANIPYYLTSPLIRKFLESENPPEEIILMLQKEVAQRICSKPPNMSLLAVSVQFYADTKIVSNVSKNCFWPAPKIDSAIIKITPRGQTSRPTGGLTSTNLFFKIVKAGFSQPRKQLAGNLLALSHAEGSKEFKLDKKEVNSWLLENKINPTQRAETLSVEEWISLTKTFNNIKINE